MQDTPITILVSESEKAAYRHWCIDHADGNMSMALRVLVRQIIKCQPTAEQVDFALAALKVLAGEDGA